MDIFAGLIDEKTLSVLKVFLSQPEEIFHIKKVSNISKVPLATTFRIINNLLKNKFLQVKKISKFKVYSLADNKKTRKLRGLI